MRAELGLMRRAQGKDRKLAMIRRASTLASTKNTISGKPKVRGGAKPVTLPKLKFSDSSDEC